MCLVGFFYFLRPPPPAMTFSAAPGCYCAPPWRRLNLCPPGRNQMPPFPPGAPVIKSETKGRTAQIAQAARPEDATDGKGVESKNNLLESPSNCTILHYNKPALLVMFFRLGKSQRHPACLRNSWAAFKYQSLSVDIASHVTLKGCHWACWHPTWVPLTWRPSRASAWPSEAKKTPSTDRETTPPFAQLHALWGPVASR